MALDGTYGMCLSTTLNRFFGYVEMLIFQISPPLISAVFLLGRAHLSQCAPNYQNLHSPVLPTDFPSSRVQVRRLRPVGRERNVPYRV